MLELTISDGATTVTTWKRCTKLMKRVANKRAVLNWRLDEEMFPYSADPKGARRAVLFKLNQDLAKLGARIEDIGHGHAVKLRNPVTIKEGEDL